MQSPDYHNAEKHSEVEHLEYLRGREGQNYYAKELGHCNAGQNGATHLGQALLGAGHIGMQIGHDHRPGNVGTELHGDANTLHMEQAISQLGK